MASYYETHFWHKEIHSIAAEGARNHGLLNITPDDFSPHYYAYQGILKSKKNWGLF